jgi:ankyrin repeat protein
MVRRINIFDAVRSDDLAAVEACLAAGAKLDVSDSRGWTPLHHAADAGRLGAVTLLLDGGVDPNQLDRFGKPPLFRAVFAGHGDVVRLLRARGGDPLLGVAQFAREVGGPMSDLFDDLPADLPPHQPPAVTGMTSGRIPASAPDASWQSEHSRLWKLLVPARGAAPTIQGELIRATGRLADEAYRNGNINWGEMHIKMCEFLAPVLDDPAVFSAKDRARWRAAIKCILADHDTPDTRSSGSTYYQLSEAAVRWCHAKPELIPREEG